jgi:hypothetical protein
LHFRRLPSNAVGVAPPVARSHDIDLTAVESEESFPRQGAPRRKGPRRAALVGGIAAGALVLFGGLVGLGLTASEGGDQPTAINTRPGRPPATNFGVTTTAPTPGSTTAGLLHRPVVRAISGPSRCAVRQTCRFRGQVSGATRGTWATTCGGPDQAWRPNSVYEVTPTSDTTSVCFVTLTVVGNGRTAHSPPKIVLITGT